MCVCVCWGGELAEGTLQVIEWSEEVQRAVLWAKRGMLEVSTLPCPALTFSSGLLKTTHSHILEKPQRMGRKHQRIGRNLLEISCCTISCSLRTSRLMIASLFLEQTF